MSEQVKRYSVDCPLAYPPLDGERKVVLATDYDALHAEAEALRSQHEEALGLLERVMPLPHIFKRSHVRHVVCAAFAQCRI